MADIFEVAHYQGREYRPTLNKDGSVNLLSSDPTDLMKGFHVFEPGLFIKTVSRAEIDDAYRLVRYGILQGRRFPIVLDENGRFLLEDGGKGIDAVELGFDQVGRAEFQKWVHLEELDRVEDCSDPEPSLFRSRAITVPIPSHHCSDAEPSLFRC